MIATAVFGAQYGAPRRALRGSIAGTRLDVEQALALAADGVMRAAISTRKLEDINRRIESMHAGQIDGAPIAASPMPKVKNVNSVEIRLRGDIGRVTIS